MGIVFSGRIYTEAWEASIPRLLRDGQWVPTERGMRAIELLNVMFCIEQSELNPGLPARYGFDKQFVASHIGTFHESYTGNSIRSRLFNFRGGFNQIDAVAERLQTKWYSRRAVVVTWNPGTDTITERPPCPVSLQFLVREKRLHVTAVVRSNDAWLAVVPDMLALMQIQCELAQHLELSIGQYHHISTSYHMYEPDVGTAQRAFSVRDFT